MSELTEIYRLIPKVMADVGVIEKASKNASQGYKFRGIDDVMGAFQPVLAKHQIFFVPEVVSATQTDRESKNGGTLIYTSLTVAYTFYAPDGSFVRAVVVGEAMDSGDKSSNKAMSAALKYALLQVFCVPVEAQDDADATSHEVARKVSPQDARKLQVAKPVYTGKRATLTEMCKEIINKGISRESVLERIASLCDGQSDFSKLSDGDVDGLIEEFGKWLDTLNETRRAA